MWTKYDTRIHSVTGVEVQGDRNVPPTRWWNHLWLLWFGWKTVVLFEVPQAIAEAGYQIGYWPSAGQPRINTTIYHHRFFQMRIGYENCRFFCMSGGKEIHFIVVERNDTRIKDIPLL